MRTPSAALLTVVSIALGFVPAAGAMAASDVLVTEPCPQVIHVDGVRYTTEGSGLTKTATGPGDFTGPTAAECSGGAASLTKILQAKLPTGGQQTIAGWSCTTRALGAACLRNAPQRDIRIDATCDTATPEDEEGGDGDEDGAGDTSAPPADETEECLVDEDDGSQTEAGTGAGSTAGTGSGSTAARRTFIIDRTGRKLRAPRVLGLPGSIEGSALRWKHWAAGTTTARGRVVLRVPRSKRVVAGRGSITLGARRTCTDGRRVYTRATVRQGGHTIKLRRPGCAKLPD